MTRGFTGAHRGLNGTAHQPFSIGQMSSMRSHIHLQRKEGKFGSAERGHLLHGDEPPTELRGQDLLGVGNKLQGWVLRDFLLPVHLWRSRQKVHQAPGRPQQLC